MRLGEPETRQELCDLRELLERAFPGAFFVGIWNEETGFDYAASYESPTFGELTGVPAKVLLGEPGRFTDLIVPEDREMALEAFLRAARTSETIRVVYRIHHGVSGEIRWILEHTTSIPAGRPGERHVIGVLLDITEQREKERAAGEAEARMRMIVEGTPYLFFYTQDEDGLVTYVSPSVEKITGYTVEEWLGQSHWFTTDSEINQRARLASQAHLRGEPPRGPMVIEIRHKAGHEILLEVFEHPVMAKGKPRGIQGVARDVTAEYRLREELDEARRFEALGRLTSGIAHDFNNMLQGILLSAELAIEEEGAAGETWAASVIKLAQRGRKVVRQLLAFSQQQVFQAQPLDLGRMLEEHRPVLERMMGPDIEVRIVVPEHLPKVMADETQLLQVLLNLADNARHAMSDGGTLTITARVGQESGGTRSDRVVLGIQDTGEGIDPEHLPLIFEPFFTTRQRKGGSGLGLASVRGIVRQHGGTIEVDSEPGRGTVFTIELPADTGGSETPVVEEKVVLEDGHGNGGHRVLLVEDHEDVRTALADALRLTGYEVTVASDLTTARGLLEAGPFDVVLSDLRLPDGVGYDLARPARNRNPEIVLVFLSGFLGGLGPVADPEPPAGAICLEKPVDFAELHGRIREALLARTKQKVD